MNLIKITRMNKNFSWVFRYCFLLILITGMISSCIGERADDLNASLLVSGSDTTAEFKSPNVTIEEDINPIYEIRLVSPDILQNVNINSEDIDHVIKIGPGQLLGIATPQAMYLNANLHSDEYLLINRDNTDYKEKITEHLISIMYGKDTANNTLLQKDPDYMFWFDEEYINDDVNTALAFAREFNNLSTTAQFEDESVQKGSLKDNYEVIPYHYYRISITKRVSLDDYKKDKYKPTKEELIKDKNGTLIGINGPDYVYLWNGLEGKEREYYLKKAIFWNAGLHGEVSEPDSFFSEKANSSAQLSELDKDAIKLLYGGRLSSGMNADSVRKALDINL